MLRAPPGLLGIVGVLALSLLGPACRKTAPDAAGGSDAGGGTSPSEVDAGEAPRVVAKAATKTMAAFGSEAELGAFLKELAEARKRDNERLRRRASLDGLGATPPPAAAPAQEAAKAEPGSGPGRAAESVTNVQHAGVDEGGIVKLFGDYLVVLRRGRLFTLRIGEEALTPVSNVDAFGPDVDPSGAWYDEMLISKNTVVVIGYSYTRGGTEIGVFDLSPDGKIGYRATYHLRSNDYYSSRNYASRLIGQKLVFYTPLYLSLDENDPYRSFPALRRWHRGATPAEFRRIVEPTRVYRPLVSTPHLTLHTVTTCDLASSELECTSSAVMGPAGRVFYVSPSSVYVWMTDFQPSAERAVSRSLVYRMPLDGAPPTALRAVGAPVDQFSFLESMDGNLNVLVRADSAGDGMWRAEVTQGDVALLRVPLSSFGAEAADAPLGRYSELPRPTGYVMQNRFVGSYLLYGTGSGWGWAQQGTGGKVVAVRYASGGEPLTLDLGHGVDRIEAMGQNAVVVGTDGQALHFTPIALATRPFAGPRYTRPGASQGELRSHGFFYKPESEETGLLGLPVRGAGRPGASHLTQGSASILFLRNESLHLRELGDLASETSGVPNDGCRASCVDWYGNARPLFLRGRVFALLGYEIVEGRLENGRITEKGRTNFAPGAPLIAR